MIKFCKNRLKYFKLKIKKNKGFKKKFKIK